LSLKYAAAATLAAFVPASISFLREALLKLFIGSALLALLRLLTRLALLALLSLLTRLALLAI